MSASPKTTLFPPPAPAAPAVAALCPFHDGPPTLDALLAEVAPGEGDIFDAALDLRSALLARQDAAECVALALRLRRALAGRHYLAFYRVRRWLHRTIVVQVRRWRGEPWVTFRLPIDCARADEVENTCLSAFANTLPSSEEAAAALTFAQLRYVFLREAGCATPAVISRATAAP